MSFFRIARASVRSTQFQFRTFVSTASLRSSTQENVVLPRLQGDLKTALRSKDKPRLNVLRAIMAEITNASKTQKPIESDASLYNLLLKQIKGANTAVEEFRAAKREDLVEKENTQLAVLQGYAEEIPKVAKEEVDQIVADAVKELEAGGKKIALGPVMGKVMGILQGRPCDADYVRAKIEETTASN